MGRGITVRFNISGSPPPYRDEGRLRGWANYLSLACFGGNAAIDVETDDGHVYRRNVREVSLSFDS